MSRVLVGYGAFQNNNECIHIHINSKIFLHYYCYLLCRSHTCMLLTANTLPFLMSRCTQQTCTNMNQIFTCFVLIPLLFSNQYVCECVGRGQGWGYVILALNLDVRVWGSAPKQNISNMQYHQDHVASSFPEFVLFLHCSLDVHTQ